MNIQISFSYEDAEGRENETESDVMHDFKTAQDFLNAQEEMMDELEAKAELAQRMLEDEEEASEPSLKEMFG